MGKPINPLFYLIELPFVDRIIVPSGSGLCLEDIHACDLLKANRSEKAQSDGLGGALLTTLAVFPSLIALNPYFVVIDWIIPPKSRQ